MITYLKQQQQQQQQNKFALHVQKNYINTFIVLSFVQNELGLC